jgi:hypothetical protein
MTILWLLLQLSWLSIWVCPAGLQACTHADDGSGFNGLFHQDNAWHIWCFLLVVSALTTFWYQPRQWQIPIDLAFDCSGLTSNALKHPPMAMSFTNPWGNIVDVCNADSYVNNTLTGITDATMVNPLPLPDMIGKMQAVAQIWEHILYSSGGALELPKCFWCLIYWQWINGWPEMMPNVSTPGVIAQPYARSRSQLYSHQMAGGLAGNADSRGLCSSGWQL